MAQKTKVKELVGRGLNSYHTKALQQMDRIEKKNKEQNHKISILSNELDNDYLTKTEEGSVISLEHSKEGMVYLDELQGNTLVNYCTDGSKEMTLNGDIDVEGTFVTTTEGVENGKVDVMCEGNTLVNLVNSYGYHANKYSHVCFFRSGMLKPNTRYSAIITNPSNEDMGLYWNEGIFNYVEITIPANSTKVFTNTTKAEMNIDEQSTLFKNVKTHTQAIQFKVILLEGDWTNKETPSYFEGMKSVGQDDLNGHKIEILSRNKNLLLPTARDKKIPIFLKKGTTLTLSTKDNAISNGGNVMMYDVNGEVVWFAIDTGQTSVTRTLPRDIYYMKDALSYNVNYELKYQLEISNTKTSYVEPKQNKKEILLSEPLRSLPNGVCDEIIKQNGKWYVKRKLNETYIEVPSSGVTVDIIQDDKCRIIMADYPIDIKPKQITTTINVNCDKIPSLKQTDLDGTSPNYSYGISTRIATTKGIYMWVTKDKMPNQTLDGFKDFIKNNQPKIIYELETPIYEEIIDVELITYLDTTHISNNSIIPCNMKIKNSGYNAIIKPSTLYTVAIGTDKGGTIGMNLGGAKVTTTNNVAKITTPATLTDDSLRLYGKGRKGSKIRILEGDIINIPKHFTGIQSSFEDKVQEDGTYKMEVLSNNENLFRLEDIKYSTSHGNSARPIKNGFKIISDTTGFWHGVVTIELNVKPKTTYTLGVSKKVITNAYPNQEPSWGVGYVFIREYGDKVLTEGKVKDNTRTYFRFNSGENTKIRLSFATATDVTTQKGEYDFTDLDLRESKSNLEYVDNKYNKIQFSSIEPLRKWDRFVFKDNKLMIERGSYSYTINENSQGSTGNLDVSNNTVMVRYDFLRNNLPKCKERLMGISNVLPNNISNIWSRDIPNASIEDIVNRNGYLDFRIPIANVPNKDYATAHKWLCDNNTTVVYPLAEPTYEEIPSELQKIILEGYENGTLFLDTNIPPTVTTTYAGETPIVKSVKLNKTEVLNNTEDINDNIIPYLMDMDYRVVMLQLATEELEGGVSMARLFGGTYEMIKRDILSKRLTREEYGYRLADYYNAGKLTEEQVRELEDLR